MTVQYNLNVISVLLFHRIHDVIIDVCVLGALKIRKKGSTEEARKKNYVTCAAFHYEIQSNSSMH